MTIKFKYPPINELIIGVYLDPVLQMRAEHVGLFWARVRSEFPSAQQVMPINVTPVELMGDEIGTLPRFWFTAPDDSTLIQIQRGAFIFNWRKRNDEYPHFDKLKAEFDRHYGQFVAFLHDDVGVRDVIIKACELTYVNLIEECDYWRGPADTSAVIPGISFVAWDGQQLPRDFGQRQTFQISEDMLIALNVQNRRMVSRTKQALYFELKATGNLTTTVSTQMDGWFRRAHDEIGRGFLSLTSETIQRDKWQPRKDASV